MSWKQLRRLFVAVSTALSTPLLASQATLDRSIEVPFTSEHNQVVVQVKVSGKGPFTMLLDTGTTPSAIDVAVARELRLKVQSKGHAASGGGTDRNVGYATSLPDVEVGELKVGNLEAGAIDLSKPSQALGRPLHDVLGYSLLKDRTVQIDYSKKVVRFLPPSPASSADDGSVVTLPFSLNDGVPVVEAFVNGVKVKSVLDTGWGGYAALLPATIDRLGLSEEAKRGETGVGVGYNGAAETRKGTIQSLRVGTISVDNPFVTFRQSGAGFDRRPFDISIGNQFLKDFVVTFDYRRRLVTLRRE